MEDGQLQALNQQLIAFTHELYDLYQEVKATGEEKDFFSELAQILAE